MNNTITKDSKVITSRGRFGIVIEVNNDIAVVKMGKSLYDIYINELLLVNNAKAVEVEFYYDAVSMYSSAEKDIIYIDKKVCMYDYSNPLDNQVLTIIKQKLSKKHSNKHVIVTKLNLI